MNYKKDWTVMIYMAGNNNLSVDMVYALEELQKKVNVRENENINLFVHYQNNSPEIPAIYCDFSDFENPFYQYSTEILDKFSTEKITTDPNSEAINPVLNFVDWCVNKVKFRSGNKFEKGRKAENYALIFSGHTMGFLSMGLFKDESTNLSMTMPGLQNCLETIKEKIIGKKLALLGFDSCVMSMFEVGQQFQTVAETMIASEGSIPNAGWSYAEILAGLGKGEENIKNIAREFVHKYIEKQSKYSIGGVSVDMAAWDLKNLKGLNKQFERLAKTLLECFRDETSIVYRQMRRILLQVHFNCQSFMFEQSIDLGDFCSLLIEELASLEDETEGRLNPILKDVAEAGKSVLLEIYNCVLLSGFSGGAYQFSTGISLFFPWSLSAYRVSLEDYEQLSFVKNTRAGKLWSGFLQKYLCEVSLRKAKKPEFKNSFEFNQIPVSQNPQPKTAHRMPFNPLSRMPFNPLSRMPFNPLSRMPFNPLSRIPFKPLTRFPLNPMSRMAGESGQFFENFRNFKNIESNWNIMGYTKHI